jgi:hypothetical protein
MTTATATRPLSWTPCPFDPTPRQWARAVDRAYRAWRALQERSVHPDGEFDKKQRWEPSAAERRPCCARVRTPSAAWPYSLLKHCRSIEHVAARFHVPASALRTRIAADRPRRTHPAPTHTPEI